jgi:NDP-sugar pyrophosphorylase family protein
MGELTTFIPAGGLGSRLHPHTFATPKPLLLMGSGDERVIDHPVNLSGEVAAHTWVSTDYLGDQVEAYLDGRPNVTVVRDSGTVGSGGSLVQHYGEMSDVSASGDMLILPSDHVYEDINLADFWGKHREIEADITLLTVPPKPYGEYVRMEDGLAVSIEKDPAPELVSTTGIFIVRNRYLLDFIREAKQQRSRQAWNIYHDIICPALGSAIVADFFVDEESGYWEDTGTPSRYLASNLRLSHGENVISPTANVNPNAGLEACVVLGTMQLDETYQLKNAIVTGNPQGELHVTQL